jgi:hypothetical protein
MISCTQMQRVLSASRLQMSGVSKVSGNKYYLANQHAMAVAQDSELTLTTLFGKYNLVGSRGHRHSPSRRSLSRFVWTPSAIFYFV